MSDDLLLEATRALRESAETDGAGAAFTRARIMATLHQERRRRMTRRALFWPLAAILVGSTAWAGATGKLGQVARVVVHAAGWSAPRTAPEVERAPLAQAPRAPVASEAPAAAPSTEPSPEPEATVAPVPETVAPVARRAAPSVAPAVSSAAPVTNPSGSEEQILYRTAHRAHFEEHDWATALRAWDAYLAAAPQGRLAPEALYNRALCLLRLGRTSEARRALEPFAGGKFGGYRQKEASALIAAMGGEGAAGPDPNRATPAVDP
jgi:TolA-binding protein